MNSITIFGVLQEKIDGYYRYFNFELPDMAEPISGEARIVIRYWGEQPNSRLLLFDVGTRIALQGHLDAHEKFGTIIVVEQFRTYVK